MSFPQTSGVTKIDPAPIATASPVVPGGGRSLAFLSRREALVLGVFTLFYAVGRLSAAASTPMWVDEMWTFYLARTPSIGAILHAIEDGIELNPPLSFLLAHAAQALFGASDTVTRLPAILGFWIMCISLFFFVRRRSGAACGYIAMLLPFFTFAESYAIQARPYALVLGATAAALLLWQIAEVPRVRKFAMPAFAVAVAALLSLHYYAFYVVGVIAVSEAVRKRDRNRSIWFWVSLLAGCSPLLYLMPVMKRMHAGAAHFLLTPSLDDLRTSYSDLVGPSAVVILVIIMYVLQPVSERSAPRIDPSQGNRNDLPRHEWFAGVNLLLMPFAAYVMALAFTNAFMPRYVLPVVIGLAVLVPAFVNRIGNACPHLPTTVACVLFVCFSLVQLSSVLVWAVSPTPAIRVQQTAWVETRSDLPLVIDDDNQFMQIAHYGTPAMQEQAYFLIDHQLETKYVGFDTPGRTLEVGARLAPLHVVNYNHFVEQHRQFLFLRNSSRMLGWVSRELLAEKADVRLIQFEKQHGFRGDEESIYLVTMPEHSAGDPARSGLKPDNR